MDSEVMQYISKINEGREITNLDALAGVAQVLAGTEYDQANEWASKKEDPCREQIHAAILSHTFTSESEITVQSKELPPEFR